MRATIFFAVLMLLALPILLGCDPATRYFEERYDEDLYASIPYQLDEPDTTFFLASALNEISGLTTDHKGNLLAVEDEEGVVYILDPNSGAITREIKFGKHGDYEGIEFVNGVVYITKSNGNVYYFDYPDGDDDVEVEATKINTPLSHANDVEGLGYNPATGQLLLACKGKGKIEENEAKGKCIYALHLPGQSFETDPAFAFRTKELKKFAEEGDIPVREKVSFKPSGVAVHPETGQIYIVAHAGKAIVVLQKDGEFFGYYPLKPSLFRQPEGITFASDGSLYISNESGGRSPVIRKFVPR